MSNKSLDFNISDIVWFLIGIILIITGIKNFQQADVSFTDSQTEAIATIKEIRNLVKVKNQHNLAWMPGDEGQSLNNDSLVYAGDFSRAKINFKNGSQVIILPGSILRVYHDTSGKFKMQVKKGKAFKVTEEGKKIPILVSGPIDIAEEIPETSAPISQEETPTIVIPPPTVSIIAPKDIILEQSSALSEFKWELQKGNAEDDIVFEINDPNEKKLTVKAPLSDNLIRMKISQPGIYYWIAKSQDVILDAGEFNVKRLYSPYIIRPKNKSLNNQNKITLEWSYGSDEDVTFEVETLNGENKKIIDVGTKLSLSEIFINPKLPLEWRVRAKHKEFTGPWSEMAYSWPTPEEIIPIAESQTKQSEIKIRPSVKPESIKKIFNSKYFVDRLPYEVKVKNLSEELSSLAIFYEGNEVKPSGEDSFRFKTLKAGTYNLEWYEIDQDKSQLITTIQLEVVLNPLQDSINLPQDIVLELKSNDKK